MASLRETASGAFTLEKVFSSHNFWGQVASHPNQGRGLLPCVHLKYRHQSGGFWLQIFGEMENPVKRETLIFNHWQTQSGQEKFMEMQGNALAATEE